MTSNTPQPRLLERLAQPGVVLRVAALALCALELGSALAGLLGRPTEPYDGLVATLYTRLGGQPQDRLLLLIGLGLASVFVWRFWRLASRSRIDQPPRGALGEIGLLAGLALLITPGLPFLVTALAAVLLRARPAVAFAAAQVLLNLALYWLSPSSGQRLEQVAGGTPWWADTLSLMLAMVALHGMALGLGRMAAAEAEKRRWLQAMLAEKRSAEQLQAEQLRYAERQLMARELHDLMGHHLTALNLQLQLGSALLERADSAGASQAVEKARSVAAQLLSEVRVAVSAERNSQRIDLSAALQALADGISRPQIVLELDASVRDLSPRLAHALLRCVQEAVTNAVRHARARQLRIKLGLCADDQQICLRVEDDGDRAVQAVPGNGLKGMAERMNELGGSMQLLPGPTGLTLELRCPRSA